MSRIRFTSRSGLALVGDMELPPGGDYRAAVLFAHCFTCNRNYKAVRNISRELAVLGFAVLRFDFTGLGQSEGDFSDTTFSSNLDDLEDAARWMEAHLRPPQVLVGHSLGGTAALAVAERLDSVHAVATIGSPSTPDRVIEHFSDQLETIEKQGSAEVRLAGRPFRIRRDFIEDARSHRLDERLRKLRRALLVLHGPTDEIVPVENAQQIFTAALHPKSFVSLDDADHLLSREADSRYAGRVIASWAARFLSIDQPELETGVRVSGLTDDGFLCGLQSDSHRLVADEPESAGGGDQGPTPYDYLAAALGSCTVMTLNMYARHKKLPVSRVQCRVFHEKVHAEDCADCETSTGKVDVLTREICIEGEIDSAQRRRMLEIADRCPVHRTLEGEIKIRTRESEARDKR